MGIRNGVDASLRKIGDSLVASSRPIATEKVEVEVPTVVDNVAPLNDPVNTRNQPPPHPE